MLRFLVVQVLLLVSSGIIAQDSTPDQNRRLAICQEREDLHCIVIIYEEIAARNREVYGEKSYQYAAALRPLPLLVAQQRRPKKAVSIFVNYRRVALTLVEITEKELLEEGEQLRAVIRVVGGGERDAALSALDYSAPSPTIVTPKVELSDLQPISTLEERYGSFIINGDSEGALNMLLQEYEKCRDDPKMINELAEVLPFLSVVFAMDIEHPAVIKFMQEERPYLNHRAEEDSAFGELLASLSYIDMLWLFERQKQLQVALTKTIIYPNLLDSVVALPDRPFDDFLATARDYTATIDPVALSKCHRSLELAVIDNAIQHEDALVSFVADHHMRALELPGLLLDMTLAREHFQDEQYRRAAMARKLAIADPDFADLELKKQVYRNALEAAYRNEEISLLEYSFQVSELTEGEYCKQLIEATGLQAAPDYRKLQSWLKPKEVLVKVYRYLPRKEGLWLGLVAYGAVVLHAGNHPPVYVNLPGRDTLEFEAYKQFQKEVYRSPTGQAYADYWQPLEAALGTASVIYYAPDGIYQRISPAVLAIPKTKELLLERLSVRPLASLTALGRPGVAVEDLYSALLVGDPAFGGTANVVGDGLNFRFSDQTRGDRWRQLPSTRTEVDTAASMLRGLGVAVTTLSGIKASKANLIAATKKRTPSLLHLATHAFFRPFLDLLTVPIPQAIDGNSWATEDYNSTLNYLRDGLGRYGVKDSLATADYFADYFAKKSEGELPAPLTSAAEYFSQQQRLAEKSGLILAGANSGSDGVLTLPELENFPLDSTLVVLMSACDIGKEDLVESGTLPGFRGSFRARGVRYLLSSLWPVHDQAGMRFVRRFYLGWTTEGQTIEEAFLTAQRELANEGRPLAHWGGFILTKL